MPSDIFEAGDYRLFRVTRVKIFEDVAPVAFDFHDAKDEQDNIEIVINLGRIV